MRVLWLSPVPPPAVCKELTLEPHYGGWWIWSMLRELAVRQEFEIAVAWAHTGCVSPRDFSAEGVRYHILPNPGRFVRGGGVLRKINDQVEHLFGRMRHERATKELVAVVQEFRPDVVQVFGTEHHCGLIASMIQQPLIVWIQGILDAYRHYYFGGMCRLERLQYPKLVWDHHRMNVQAEREREIFRRCQYFMGRTGWDAEHMARLQPQGFYYHVQECLRPEFYDAMPWTLDGAWERIVYATTSASLLKGTDVLIQAIGSLRARYPQIRCRIAGFMDRKNPVVRRLFRMVKQLGLSNQIEFLGQLDAARIVNELRRARVFVLPSFIENSPNSLAEAQLTGTPSIASLTGGVQDMVVDAETGILFPAGDGEALSRQIDRVLTDDDLARRLSIQSRQAARKRHAPAQVVDDLIKAYRQIVASRVLREGRSISIGAPAAAEDVVNRLEAGK